LNDRKKFVISENVEINVGMVVEKIQQEIDEVIGGDLQFFWFCIRTSLWSHESCWGSWSSQSTS